MRTTLNDGTEVEVLAQLAYPLPLTIVPELLAAIGQAVQECGYTDVSILADGPHAGMIAGRPPKQAQQLLRIADRADQHRAVLRAAAQSLRSPHLCNWDTRVAVALAEWLDAADASDKHAVATAYALVASFGMMLDETVEG